MVEADKSFAVIARHLWRNGRFGEAIAPDIAFIADRREAIANIHLFGTGLHCRAATMLRAYLVRTSRDGQWAWKI